MSIAISWEHVIAILVAEVIIFLVKNAAKRLFA